MRAKSDWGTGPPIAAIEERKLLRYRRIVVPANRVSWYRALFEREGLFRPRRSFPRAELIASTRRRTVFRFEEGPPPSRNGKSGLVLKEERYPFPALFHGIVSVPRAEREFHNLVALRSLGFPAVEPLAYGHSGLWILYHRSFLITRELTGAVNLRAWGKKKRNALPIGDVEKAMMSFSRELARLHRARCYIRTLYGKNILARPAEGGGVELALCDVPRLWWFRGKGLSFGLAARDLACLDKWARQIFPPRVRLAFLRSYLERLAEGPPARRWVRRILRSEDRMRHRTFVGRTSRGFKRVLRRFHLENFWPF